jgi:REP element-mobilizing transposase RayT
VPRANRYFLPGYVWRITHRCHQREFLLSFAQDRRRWLHWLFEAKRRHGLCVLNYVVTSNHIHLLVQDQGKAEYRGTIYFSRTCAASVGPGHRRQGYKSIDPLSSCRRVDQEIFQLSGRSPGSSWIAATHSSLG